MINGNIDILNTEVIPSSWDNSWAIASVIAEMMPKPVTVITAPFVNSSAEEDQLMSILKAGCKLQDHQYNIIALPPGDLLAWHQVRDRLRPRVVLLFDIHPGQLGITALFRLNEVNRFDSCLVVPAFPLQHLIHDKAVKIQLWTNALKPLFETKAFGDIL